MIDLETRLRADLPRLADHLLDADEPTDQGRAAASDTDRVIDVGELGAATSSASERRDQRWVRVAAIAAAIVVVIGTIAVLAGRSDRSEVHTGDDPAASTATAVEAPPAFVSDGGTVSVSIQIYSGRPDPVFVPTADEQAQLVAVLSGLPSTVPTDRAPYLGFRGFAIEGLRPSGSAAGTYRTEAWDQVRVSGYDPATFEALPEVHLDDPDGMLFDLLLTMVDAHRAELGPEYDAAFVDGLRDAGPRSPASTTTTIGYDEMPAVVTTPGPEDAVMLRRGTSSGAGALGEVGLAMPHPDDLTGTIDPRVVWTAANPEGRRDPAQHRILLLRLTDTMTGTVQADGTFGESRDRLVWVVAQVDGNAALSTISNPDETGLVDVPYELLFFDAETGEPISGSSVSDAPVREPSEPPDQPDGQR